MATADRPNVPFDSPAPIHITYVSSTTEALFPDSPEAAVELTSVSFKEVVVVLPEAEVSRRRVYVKKKKGGHHWKGYGDARGMRYNLLEVRSWVVGLVRRIDEKKSTVQR